MNRLIEGIGKPEPLRPNLAGFCSRRITTEHRVVYVVACRAHCE
ncbi:type II toxin-antitoxin system YoeB family toxin [Actinomadura meridiana]